MGINYTWYVHQDGVCTNLNMSTLGIGLLDTVAFGEEQEVIDGLIWDSRKAKSNRHLGEQ